MLVSTRRLWASATSIAGYKQGEVLHGLKAENPSLLLVCVCVAVRLLLRGGCKPSAGVGCVVPLLSIAVVLSALRLLFL